MSATYAQTRAQQIKNHYLGDLQAAREYTEFLAPHRLELDAEISKLRNAFNERHAESLHGETAFTDSANGYELELRQLAIDHFTETGEKTMDENLGVQVRTTLKYSNDDAVKWAETNAPVMICRSVDKKAFENYALKAELPFVERDDKVSAVIKGLKP